MLNSIVFHNTPAVCFNFVTKASVTVCDVFIAMSLTVCGGPHFYPYIIQHSFQVVFHKRQIIILYKVVVSCSKFIDFYSSLFDSLIRFFF